MNYLPYKDILAGFVNTLAPRMATFNKGNLGSILGPSEAIWGTRYTWHLNHTPKFIGSWFYAESIKMIQDTPKG